MKKEISKLLTSYEKRLKSRIMILTNQEIDIYESIIFDLKKMLRHEETKSNITKVFLKRIGG